MAQPAYASLQASQSEYGSAVRGRPTFGRSCSKHRRSRPDFGRNRTKCGRFRAKFGRDRWNPARRPKSGQVWPIPAQLWSKVRRNFCPTSVGLRPNVGRFQATHSVAQLVSAVQTRPGSGLNVPVWSDLSLEHRSNLAQALDRCSKEFDRHQPNPARNRPSDSMSTELAPISGHVAAMSPKFGPPLSGATISTPERLLRNMVWCTTRRPELGFSPKFRVFTEIGRRVAVLRRARHRTERGHCAAHRDGAQSFLPAAAHMRGLRRRVPALM